eukprot:4459748-Pleurochrysis_carterae.AAC.2
MCARDAGMEKGINMYRKVIVGSRTACEASKATRPRQSKARQRKNREDKGVRARASEQALKREKGRLKRLGGDRRREIERLAFATKCSDFFRNSTPVPEVLRQTCAGLFQNVTLTLERIHSGVARPQQEQVRSGAEQKLNATHWDDAVQVEHAQSIQQRREHDASAASTDCAVHKARRQRAGWGTKDAPLLSGRRSRRAGLSAPRHACIETASESARAWQRTGERLLQDTLGGGGVHEGVHLGSGGARVRGERRV